MKKKGFTLVELLAVIVILAVISLITTPMILNVIETARKGAAESSALGYVDAIEKQIMLNQLDSSATQIIDGVYELPIEGISVKGEQPSEGWIVIEDSQVMNYSMKVMDYVVTKDEDVIAEGEIAEKPSIEVNYICKRATQLHTETCTQTDTNNFCSGAGYTINGSKGTTTITYGNPTTKDGKLTSGDAFDCDVDGSGTYDEDERFYYVSSLNGDSTSDIAVLIYYNNISLNEAGNVQADNGKTSLKEYYESIDENWHGPVTAIQNLPTTNDWTSVSLSNVSRTITNETGETTTGEGVNTISNPFNYVTGDSKYAARLLTVKEINSACNITAGSYPTGELDVCNYLLENTRYSNPTMGTNGYWLENARSISSASAWNVASNGRYVASYYVSSASYAGVRPVIEVPKDNIEF